MPDQTNEVKLEVDNYASTTEIEAPPAQDEPDSRPASAATKTIAEIDVRAARIGSMIWATGYAFDFNWVELPIFDELGQLLHYRGVTAAPGIYLLGLAWLHKSKSSFLYGVGEDAVYLAERISTEHG